MGPNVKVGKGTVGNALVTKLLVGMLGVGRIAVGRATVGDNGVVGRRGVAGTAVALVGLQT